MIRYIHGSQDSTDLDVLYICEEMPSFVDCQRFCQSDPQENRNLAVIEDGVVVRCFKGAQDEVNNALLRTYPLHEQAYPLLVQRALPRDVFAKDIRAVRKIITPFTHSALRAQAKDAQRRGWTGRLAFLKRLNLLEIDQAAVRHWATTDLLKSIAFQLGMALGLHEGVELYTKAEIAAHVPLLRPALYRQEGALQGLQEVLERNVRLLEALDVQELSPTCVMLRENGAQYDLHLEQRLC